MSRKMLLAACALFAALHGPAAAAPTLDLAGYADDTGAITVLHGGDSADPYFAMQALLLAHDNGFDIAAPAQKFADWLLPKQKPDGTFDRFCRDPARNWVACKTADADDALLAIWIRLLDAVPSRLATDARWQKSRETSRAALEHLFQPSRGVYMVSPVYLHGLFMDNLEVWSLKRLDGTAAGRAGADRLARAIHATFWDPVNRRYLVATQLEQRAQPPAFYPDHVAQVFPLLVGFPPAQGPAASSYGDWMRMHRALWLAQGKHDYPWGLIAVLALRQNDKASVQCWLREAGPLRHSARWAVTDETAWQIVAQKGLRPAAANQRCD